MSVKLLEVKYVHKIRSNYFCLHILETKSTKVAEIVQDIKYEKCCNYPEEKPHALGTEKDDAETCSKLVCEASNILPYANWVSKSVKHDKMSLNNHYYKIF